MLKNPNFTHVHPEIKRVLQALRQHRTPGWNYPAYYLNVLFESVDQHNQSRLYVDAEACTNTENEAIPVAICAAADTALAAALRSKVGLNARMATLNAKLSFPDITVNQRIQAHSEITFLSEDLPLKMGGSKVSIKSGDSLLCVGEANFAILNNGEGLAPHPMFNARPLHEIDPLTVAELSDTEKDVLIRAEKAIEATDKHDNFTFLENFWGLVPNIKDGIANCNFSCGTHVGNRVGHAQGGVLLGLAINTSKATLESGWRLLDIAANYVKPGNGGRLHARSHSYHVGRTLAHVGCEVFTEDNQLVLKSQATFVRTAR